VLGRTFDKLKFSEGRTFFYLKTPSKVSGTLIKTHQKPPPQPEKARTRVGILFKFYTI